MVAEPRRVLAEDFDLPLPDDVEIRVQDSSAEIRYFVLPQRPGRHRHPGIHGRRGQGERMTARPGIRLLAELPDDRVPPRSNGELVFRFPVGEQGFRAGRCLSEQSLLNWQDFRAELIARIAGWERGPRDTPYRYYTHWLAALERSVVWAGLISAEPVADSVAHILAQPQKPSTTSITAGSRSRIGARHPARCWR